jgi:hypothetical protein
VYWPDTIKKSESFSIPLVTLHNADEVQVIISKTSSTVSITYTALVEAGTINISTLSIAPLSASGTASIQCNFYKNSLQTINGNQINFRNVTSFIKTVQVRN